MEKQYLAKENMSKLEELIEQYCPDGVEWKHLEEFCEIKTGKGITKKDSNENGTYPIISGGVTPMGYYHIFNREGRTVTISRVGANAGLVSFIDKRFYLNDKCFSIIPSNGTNTKFLYYILSAREADIKGMQSEGGVPTINTQKVGSIKIPVPPLPVQEEIVRVLDAFTELQAELQAELQKRKQQYNFYRDNLLDFKDINRGGQEIKWMKLKDVATQWYRGAGIKREEVGNEGMPCIRYGEIHTSYNIWFKDCISHTDETKQATKKYAEYGDILFAITSEDIPLVGNSVAYLGKEKIMVGGDIVVMKHNQDPRYMAYALSTSDAIKQKGKGKVKSKVVHTNVPSLQEIIIPIPPMEEQQRIADILDRFDTLTNDLTSGLPAEMEKRRQQYEYYRDRLLTFKRKKA